MSAAQLKARANFKKAIAYRKKTGCTLKQAFAHVKGGKVTTIKKKPVVKKKVAVKRKTAKKIGATMFVEKGESKTKRPTKVIQIKRSKKGTFEKFKTVGSINNAILMDYQKVLASASKLEQDILTSNIKLKTLPVAERSFLTKQIVIKKKYLLELNKHKSELKKLL